MYYNKIVFKKFPTDTEMLRKCYIFFKSVVTNRIRNYKSKILWRNCISPLFLHLKAFKKLITIIKYVGLYFRDF